MTDGLYSLFTDCGLTVDRKSKPEWPVRQEKWKSAFVQRELHASRSLARARVVCSIFVFNCNWHDRRRRGKPRAQFGMALLFGGTDEKSQS